MNILFYKNKDFSIGKVSETISNLQEQLSSFRSSIPLRNDKQNKMGLIDAFNFLLQNCINSYESFNNILKLLFKQPQAYSHQSIGSKTEISIQNLISQTFNTSVSIIGELPNLTKHSTLEQIINDILFSSLKPLQEYINAKTNEDNQYQNIIVDFMNILFDKNKESSIEKSSETISHLQKQLNLFRSSISLHKDQQNEMGLIDAFNFLLQKCINFYDSFNNISKLLFEQPKTYSYQSIGSKTETSIQNLISQTSQLSVSIIGESLYFSENLPLEQIINEINSSISTSLQESANAKTKEINQYQNIIVEFLKVLYYKNYNFSIEKTSETISNLHEQLNLFRLSIPLRNDEQNEMGSIEAFNFLLQNCINSYESFNNISKLLFEQPKILFISINWINNRSKYSEFNFTNISIICFYY
jgi:hypothetical protein